MKHTLKRKILTSIAILFFGMAIAIFAHIASSPAAQLLVSIISFSESTLDDPSYLFYDIDIMDMFQNYMNSDVSYEGEVYFTKIKNLNFSGGGEIHGKRSFSQKRLSCESDLNILWEDLGGMNLYIQDETIYMFVPLLGDDVAFAFDTDSNLFKKGPSFTSDVDQKWFHENATNIFNFMYSIEIEKTGNTYESSDGTESQEYKMTIPQGEGQFLWDLLGMEAPEHDIITSIYLDKKYHIQKISIDLSHSIEGATLELLGSNCNTMQITTPLPDNELSIMTISRDSSVINTNSYISNLTYYANNSKTYTLDSVISMKKIDGGVTGKISDLTLKCGKEELATGYYKGTILKEDNLPDVFASLDADLSEVTVINWKEIRDDTQSFVNELLEKSKKTMRFGLLVNQ